MNPIVDRILHEVKKVIVGKDEVLEKILMAFISQGHVLLDDVPGTGKTTAALAFSRALGLQYSRIQFTPDVLPSDIVGFSVYDKLSLSQLRTRSARQARSCSPTLSSTASR